MEPKTTKKPRKPRATVISEAQEAYVEAILDGKSKAEAALSAGYSHGQSSSAAERSALVQNALAERREELSSATQITRVGVLNGILEAIEMARLQGEPLVTGFHEIPAFDRDAVVAAIRADQAGASTFPEFLAAIWQAGVSQYIADFGARKVTYYGVTGESYEESYPAVSL